MREMGGQLPAFDALQFERNRSRALLGCVGDAVLTLDGHGRITAINPAAQRLTGWPGTTALGRHCDDVLALLDEHTRVPLLLPADASEDGVARSLPGNLLLLPKDGALLPVEGSMAGLGMSQRGQGWVVALRDVSQARGLVAQLAYQAAHDALTGLANRVAFDRNLCSAIATIGGDAPARSLLYLDLDQFKIVNDTCGHHAGDAMLAELAVLLRRHVRHGDTLARLGGDEFGVLLTACTAAQALMIGERMRSAIAAHVFFWKGEAFNCGVSIGHVHFADATTPANALLSRADEACHVAKELGRNRIHTYQHGEEAQARYHSAMQWVGGIHRAFEDDRFVLYSQPIFSITHAGKAASHHEVLLRLRGKDGALVPPMSFLPAAERYNLMPRLDRWVVQAVLDKVAAAHDDPALCAVSFAINISGSTLGDATFADFLLDALQASRLPGNCIVFEITETAAIANLGNAVRLIDALRGIGCRFALDDFGSGLSSFTYLKQLPVDFLKIDGSFVKGVATDAVDRAMVASIHQIGKLMGLCTVAECVEDDAILQVLREIGVDYAQGYGMQRPQPLEECLAGLSGHADVAETAGVMVSGTV